jgi:hypothetical protein
MRGLGLRIQDASLPMRADLPFATKFSLMLRSAPQERVSKHEAAASFETPAFARASAGSSG